MALFKFQNYSAIKNLQDNPRVVATKETVNGNVFGVKDNELVDGVSIKEAQVPFVDAAAAKAGDVWVMMNIIDKPEIRDSGNYSVDAGERIRAVNLNKMSGEIVELSSALVKPGDEIAVKDTLVPTDNSDVGHTMKWKKKVDVSEYSCYLEVTDLTAFGLFTIDNKGVGYEAKIKTNVIASA